MTKSCTVHASETPVRMPKQMSRTWSKAPSCPLQQCKMARHFPDHPKFNARDQQSLTVTAFWCHGERSTRRVFKSCLYKQGCSHQQVMHACKHEVPAKVRLACLHYSLVGEAPTGTPFASRFMVMEPACPLLPASELSLEEVG